VVGCLVPVLNREKTTLRKKGVKLGDNVLGGPVQFQFQSQKTAWGGWKETRACGAQVGFAGERKSWRRKLAIERLGN